MIIEHYCTKLQDFQLDKKKVAISYINDFIIWCQKLEKRNEGNMAETKRHKFLEKIMDDDCDIIV
jgi:hypothetical protein